MPNHGDAEILQILGGQPRQQFGIDSIIAERGGVLFKPEFPQPIGDLDRHRRVMSSYAEHSLGGYSTRILEGRPLDAEHCPEGPVVGTKQTCSLLLRMSGAEGVAGVGFRGV